MDRTKWSNRTQKANPKQMGFGLSMMMMTTDGNTHDSTCYQKDPNIISNKVISNYQGGWTTRMNNNNSESHDHEKPTLHWNIIASGLQL